MNISAILSLVLLLQTPADKSVVGTVTSINAPVTDIEVKPDNGPAVSIKVSTATTVQRIAPGETDLKNAVTMTTAELAKGDRVLVTLAANPPQALRVLVMSATDIAKRNQADQQDWIGRGISGIVAGRNGNDIIFKIRTPQGEVQQTVTVSDKTIFRRYAADSIRFGDAKPSKLGEVSIGDQLRARGVKSPDGMKVAAEEVVFGTFTTRAASVVAVDLEKRQLSVKEVGSGKSFVIRVSPDSQIKAMPSALAPPRGGPPNLAQMVDGFPAGKLDEVKPGTSVVVSSTRGAETDQVTAILLVTNADLLIRMATPPGQRGGVITFGAGVGGGGFGVLNIP